MDKRGLLTFALCAAVLFFYYQVILPIFYPMSNKAGLAPSAQDRAATATAAATPTAAAATTSAVATTAPAAKPGLQPPQPKTALPKPKSDIPLQDDIVVETDLYRTVWTNQGGALKNLVLKRFKARDRKHELELIRPIRGEDHAASDAALEQPASRSRLALDMHSFVIQKLKADYGLERARYRVHADPDAKTLKFFTRCYVDAARTQSVAVTKTFTLADGQYNIDVAIEVANLTANPIVPTYSLSAGTGISVEDTNRPRLEAMAGTLKGQSEIKVERESARKLSKGEVVPVARCESWDIRWAAIANKYFAAALVADPKETERVAQALLWGPIDAAKLAKLEADPRISPKRARYKAANVGAALRMSMPMLAPGQRYTDHFTFFVGPKSSSVLAKYPDLVQMPGYGMFGTVSRGLLWLMGGCYAVVPNYGVAIIILTFLVRLGLHPLSRKSQISMFRMQKLQPKIAELRDRHKNDKRKQGEEQMKLFRENKVNPMGGCLPMLVQIPIFIGLYRGLDLSIELRQAPFALWIQDLARPDTLCKLPFALPLLGNDLNILPILMTITFVIQQQMMPKSGDPKQQQQQKMMKFMPIVFGFMLYHMPSGLTLYWLTSTLLGIVEQKIIKAQLAKME